LCVRPTANAQAPREISLDRYVSVLKTVRSGVVRDLRTGGRGAADPLAKIQYCTIRIGDSNSSAYVDNRPLMDTIVNAENNPKRRSERLTLVLNTLNALIDQISESSSLSQGAWNAKTAAQAEFRGSKFASDMIDVKSRSFFEKIGDSIGNFFKRLFSKFHMKPIESTAFIWNVPAWFAELFLILVCSIAGGILIWRLTLLVLSRHKSIWPQADVVTESGIAVTLEEQSLVSSSDFDGLMTLAQQSASKGDYRSAFRLTYLASLVFLDSIEKIRLKRSLTNWECIAPLKQDNLRSEFEIMEKQTRKFDIIWYGLKKAGRDDYQDGADAFRSLKDSPGSSVGVS